MFHIHKWSKWSKVGQADIKKFDILRNRSVIIGYMFIQSRTCEKCGKVQYDEKQIEANI